MIVDQSTCHKPASDKKILFVNHAAVLGGAEICLIDLAKAYRDVSQVLLFEKGPLQDSLEALNIFAETITAADSASFNILSLSASPCCLY